MSNLAEQKRYTYADYAQWDDKTRYELINGIAHAMASPSRLHQKASGEIFRQLSNFLRGKTCEVYHAPFDVRLNADSFDNIVVQPDVFVVCDESKHDGKSVIGAPDMVIEILSPSNPRHDMFIKTMLYRKAGVREYWIIDPINKNVQAFILESGKYIVSDYNDGDIIPVHVLEGCEINLADVFYHTAESELAANNELEISQKIIKAFKETGLNDEQIEKAIKKLYNEY